MDNEQLMRLRRQVRRDENIACGPARLFSEIIDLHLLDKGCIAEDEQLGLWLNASTRTIRRWRGELEQAGYLRKEKRDGRRHLVPVNSGRQNCRTDVSDKTGQCPDVTDNSGQESPDKSGQHREINMPAERESAPAREGDDEKAARFNKLQKLADGQWTKDEVRDHAEDRYGDPEDWRLAVYELAHPDYQVHMLTKNEWKQKIDQLQPWAKAVKKGVKRDWQPNSVDAREDAYEDMIDNKTTTGGAGLDMPEEEKNLTLEDVRSN